MQTPGTAPAGAAETAAAAPRTASAGLPLPVIMVMAALVLGIAAGTGGGQLLHGFGRQFGTAVGDFSLIVIASMVLAECLASTPAWRPLGGAFLFASPLGAAGMVCPDTAYSAMSHAAGSRRLHLAFGSYAGFKLLAPAGPLIVATGLGVTVDPALLVSSACIAVPVIAAGWLWAGNRSVSVAATEAGSTAPGAGLRLIVPFALLAGALLLGVIGWRQAPVLELLSKPQGALIAAAAAALALSPSGDRRKCVEAALGRSGRLLLMIGAAAALGAELVGAAKPETWVTSLPQGAWALVALFALAASVKSLQGSSMVTFVTVSAVVGPYVAAAGVSGSAAVLAVCLGSFAVLLPNDSFYWLVRTDALRHQPEWEAMKTLSIGSAIQAFCGLCCLLLAVAAGWI